MLKRRYKPQINHNSEFELDLAPLLAVMVKLVPVLLVSSAFVQLMIIETELPQVVQQVMAAEEKKERPTTVVVHLDKKEGIQIVTNRQGKESINNIHLIKDKEFNYDEFYKAMLEIKKNNPEVFKVEMNPAADVTYSEIVKTMDRIRKSQDKKLTFPIKDEKTGKTVATDYMFPEVVFGNTTEG